MGMLTPQDIQEKEFGKAVFGGYDMTAVDDFLEELLENYTSLYKENATLKSKLKVLVEKVEEYRSTEDAMRMALLTAQKMSDELMEETRKKCEKMLNDAESSAARSRADVSRELEDEKARLNAAKEKTASFVSASRKLADQYIQFMDKLGEVTKSFGGTPQEAPAAENDQVRSPEPEPAGSSAAARGGAARQQVPPQAADDQDIDDEETEEDTEREIESVVSDVLSESDASAETRRFDAEALRRAQEAAMNRSTWDEEDELATPRPKFDFTDLKFGPNYTEEKKK